MKRRTLFFFALPCCTAALLDAQVSAPKIGFARYADSTVHAVYGVQSAFVVSDKPVGVADAASFSDYGGLLSTNGRIQLLDRAASLIAEYDSGESRPVLGIDGDLTSAIAWLPGRHALLHWNGKSLAIIQTNDGLEQVTSVRVQSATSAKLLISERGGAVSEAVVSLETGNLVSMTLLPGVQAPAYQQNSFVLFQDANGLEIQSPAGEALRTFPLSAGDVRFERMSSEWLHLSSRTTKQNWVLHLTKRGAQLAELPETAARSTAASPIQQETTK